MSANQRVAGLRTVAARVRAARIDLRLLAEAAASAAAGLPEKASDPLHVAGCGALVHSWYNEVEKTFEVIARRLDGFDGGAGSGARRLHAGLTAVRSGGA